MIAWWQRQRPRQLPRRLPRQQTAGGEPALPALLPCPRLPFARSLRCLWIVMARSQCVPDCPPGASVECHTPIDPHPPDSPLSHPTYLRSYQSLLCHSPPAHAVPLSRCSLSLALPFYCRGTNFPAAPPSSLLICFECPISLPKRNPARRQTRFPQRAAQRGTANTFCPSKWGQEPATHIHPHPPTCCRLGRS